MPMMIELVIKTGRRIEDIRAGLLSLEHDNYITWADKSMLRDIVIGLGQGTEDRHAPRGCK
ncbi:UNVERIFIED_CONTAM: hypothetical protein ABIC26_000163 [Paenibacillus sp. PvR008]